MFDSEPFLGLDVASTTTAFLAFLAVHVAAALDKAIQSAGRSGYARSVSQESSLDRFEADGTGV
jgi:hypothetical protein